MHAYNYEYTDTFGGDANYCWVQRGTVKAASDLAAVRKVKAALGITGWACRREDYGDTIRLTPRNTCTTVFITNAE